MEGDRIRGHRQTLRPGSRRLTSRPARRPWTKAQTGTSKPGIQTGAASLTASARVVDRAEVDAWAGNNGFYLVSAPGVAPTPERVAGATRDAFSVGRAPGFRS